MARVTGGARSVQRVTSRAPRTTLLPLADTLVAVVTDPDVGFTSGAAYSEGAEEICDGPWLDWYGQGNGSPEPEDNTDWC